METHFAAIDTDISTWVLKKCRLTGLAVVTNVFASAPASHCTICLQLSCAAMLTTDAIDCVDVTRHRRVGTQTVGIVAFTAHCRKTKTFSIFNL